MVRVRVRYCVVAQWLEYDTADYKTRRSRVQGAA